MVVVVVVLAGAIVLPTVLEVAGVVLVGTTVAEANFVLVLLVGVGS